MYACPSCQSKTISFLRKWCSWPATPVTCSNCKSRWAIATADSSRILVVATVVVTLSGFGAAAVKSLYPLLLGLCLAVLYYFWQQHRTKLTLISDEEFKVAKRTNALMLLAAIFPSLFT
jgi:hypothetical protein